MLPIEFCYYLQGYYEIVNTPPSKDGWSKIVSMLNKIEKDISENTSGFIKANHFIMWLRGFVDLCPDQTPSLTQWSIITEHLGLVFIKVTSERGTEYDFITETQSKCKEWRAGLDKIPSWKGDPSFVQGAQTICSGDPCEVMIC